MNSTKQKATFEFEVKGWDHNQVGVALRWSSTFGF